jgi:oligopeptide transport system substrate-binding protein
MEGIDLFKKSLAMLLVLMMVIGMLAGCSSPAPAEEQAPATEESTEAPAEDTTSEAPAEDTMSEVEQVLYWNVGSEPKTLDPGLNAASDGGNVINNMFEGLMREVNGKIEPGIAESYTVSDDQMTYTFTLRDAKWSDGQAITANDFEYAWTRVLDPETASEYSWIFGEANVDTFKAIDDKTFEVTLKAPTPYFLGLTAFYTFFPVRQDAVEAGADGAWAVDPAKSIVNGPFMLEDYRNGDKMVLVKNPNYWRADQVKLERIEGLMIVDQATALTGYESGQIQVIDDMPTAEIPRLLAEDPTFMIMPMDGVYYYALNTTVEPMDDVRVRRALTLAIDRTAIVETVAKGGQIPATTMVSQASRDENGDVFSVRCGDYGIPVDGSGVEEAKQLLADAGYPNGEGFPS